MEIRINEYEDDIGSPNQTLYINGNYELNVHSLCDCPEDAIIGRDLVSVDSIVSLMEDAYQAGLNKEGFKVTYTEENDDY